MCRQTAHRARMCLRGRARVCFVGAFACGRVTCKFGAGGWHIAAKSESCPVMWSAEVLASALFSAPPVQSKFIPVASARCGPLRTKISCNRPAFAVAVSLRVSGNTMSAQTSLHSSVAGQGRRTPVAAHAYCTHSTSQPDGATYTCSPPPPPQLRCRKCPEPHWGISSPRTSCKQAGGVSVCRGTSPHFPLPTV